VGILWREGLVGHYGTTGAHVAVRGPRNDLDAGRLEGHGSLGSSSLVTFTVSTITNA
jgi:hypothetical protein